MTASADELMEFTYFRGRVALYSILRALGIRRGDEVATQAFTCLAVPEGILATGASPLWVDIEAGGVNMDPLDLERKLTPTTKAVIVQHTFGIPADYPRLLGAVRARGIPIIEDCCHTLASSIGGRTVGTLGTAAFFSFEWGKPIAIGVGGSAVANDPSLRELLRLHLAELAAPPFARIARTQLQYLAFRLLFRPSLYWPVKDLFHRLAALGAAEGNYNPVNEGASLDFRLGMASSLRRRLARRLRGLAGVTTASERVAAAYRSRIFEGAVHHVPVPSGTHAVYARYPLFADHKTKLLAAARVARVELADWYATPIHPLSHADCSAVRYRSGACPRAELVSARIVSLPTHLRTTPADVERAVQFLNEVRL